MRTLIVLAVLGLASPAQEPKAKIVLVGKDRDHPFGTVNGHFHDCFGIEAFRRGLVNGILWAAKLDVPKGGAPCAVTPKDLELPPDTRKK